jgi:hypothetical protein
VTSQQKNKRLEEVLARLNSGMAGVSGKVKSVGSKYIEVQNGYDRCKDATRLVQSLVRPVEEEMVQVNLVFKNFTLTLLAVSLLHLHLFSLDRRVYASPRCFKRRSRCKIEESQRSCRHDSRF